MRQLFLGLAAGLLMAAGWGLSAVSAGEPAPPTASEIEETLRQSLTEGRMGSWARTDYRNAELKALELLALDPLSPSRWHADVAVLFDFGAPPPGIIGFERERFGKYQVLLERDDGDWVVRRFQPVGKVKPLPDVG